MDGGYQDRPALTPELIESFLRLLLLKDMATPRGTPEFHRVMWRKACSPHPKVAIAAPRSHAKSAAITTAYTLAAALFRHEPNIVIVSRTYAIATEFIRTLKDILLDNDKLRQAFHVNELIKDTEDDFIASVGTDHYQFRIQAIGFGGNVRGLNWGSQRPTLIVMDDCEDDEMVMSADRREKAMNWALAALLPSRDPIYGKVRAVGTFMHLGAMLVKFVNDDSWDGIVFEAHNDDFSEILWPEMYTKEMLLEIRRGYESQGRLDLYNMEYRNRVIDTSSGYFRKDEFQSMTDEHRTNRFKSQCSWYAGGDFAWSLREKRDYTVMPVVCVDSDNNMYVHFVKRARMDGEEVVEEMFAIQDAFKPEMWFNEKGAIAASLQAAVNMKQRATGVFLNIQDMPAIKDKRTRARTLQARMRAKSVYWDTEAEWFPEVFQEFMEFDRGEHDDCVDALAHIAIGLAGALLPLNDEERDDEMYETMRRETTRGGGRNRTCGY